MIVKKKNDIKISMSNMKIFIKKDKGQAGWYGYKFFITSYP